MIWLVSYIILFASGLAVFVHKRAAFTYLKNIAIGVDQLGNAMLGGDPDETISSVAGKARDRNKFWGCWLCKILDAIDKRHCAKSKEDDEGRRSVWKMNKHVNRPPRL